MQKFIVILSLIVFSFYPRCFGEVHPLLNQKSNKYSVKAFVAASEQLQINSPFAAEVEEIYVKEGEEFEEGDDLVKFNCESQESALKRAQSELEIAKIQLQSKEKLFELDGISKLDLESSRMNVQKSEAEIEYHEHQQEKCLIKAPFKGAVHKIKTNAHEFLTAGQPVMEILNPESLKIQLFIPTTWISWVKKDTPFKITLEENKKTYNASIESFAPKIYPLIKSVEASAIFTYKDSEVLPGMSGDAIFEGPEQNG